MALRRSSTRTRVATSENEFQREFKKSLGDVDDAGAGNRNSDGRHDSNVDDDEFDGYEADMADDDEFDDVDDKDKDKDNDDNDNDNDVDEDDVDEDGGADMAEDDDFDDDQTDLADDDEFDDDQAEMVDDEDDKFDDDEAEMADESVDEEFDDVDDDREAMPASRLVSRERTSTATKTSNRRAPQLSPQLADGVRYLLNRYELAHAATVPQNVAVVSALSGEGVTTVSQALAEVLAVDFSVSVCWVDFSWTSNRRGSSRNGFSSDPGLYDVLLDRATLDDVLVSNPGSAVTYLPAGEVAEEDRHAMVRWPHLSDVVADLRSSFDHVVFDSAPLLANSDALALLRYADAHLLVTKHGATTIRQVKATAAELQTIPSLGALLNKYNPSTPSFIRRMFSE